MKTKKILLLSLLLSFVLCSCSAGKKKPDSFLVMKSTKVVYYEGDEVVYEQETTYHADEIIEREDGLYEIRGTQETEEGESNIIWLYTDKGILIGSRSVDTYGSMEEYLSILDFTVDSYTYTQQNFDEFEDNVIYYDDDSYEEVKIENGVIVESKLYDSNDQLIFHIKCNEYGYTESLKYYVGGTLNYSITSKYKEVSLD